MLRWDNDSDRVTLVPERSELPGPDDEPCATCIVPGGCNPRHVDCELSDEQKNDIEWDRGDAAYHAITGA